MFSERPAEKGWTTVDNEGLIGGGGLKASSTENEGESTSS